MLKATDESKTFFIPFSLKSAQMRFIGLMIQIQDEVAMRTVDAISQHCHTNASAPLGLKTWFFLDDKNSLHMGMNPSKHPEIVTSCKSFTSWNSVPRQTTTCASDASHARCPWLVYWSAVKIKLQMPFTILGDAVAWTPSWLLPSQIP